ncbi:MAG: hypothetical protein Q4F43_10065, partial [Eubacteriales bacterium]|nr:hypothetical protein [Eubacteriales bacterium]
PNYTATVWAGYDNNTKLAKDEESLAMIIWHQIMANIDVNKHASDFEKPDDITSAVVCDDSGLLAVDGYCKDHAHTEYFVKGTEPTSYCPTGLKKKQKADDKKKKEEEERRRKAEEEAAKNKLNISPGTTNKLPGRNN